MESEKVIRKNYLVSLDKEKTDFVKGYLKRSGINFSSFLENSVVELYKMIKEEKLKDPGEMKPYEFLQVLADMTKRVCRDPEE